MEAFLKGNPGAVKVVLLLAVYFIVLAVFGAITPRRIVLALIAGTFFTYGGWKKSSASQEES